MRYITCFKFTVREIFLSETLKSFRTSMAISVCGYFCVFIRMKFWTRFYIGSRYLKYAYQPTQFPFFWTIFQFRFGMFKVARSDIKLCSRFHFYKNTKVSANRNCHRSSETLQCFGQKYFPDSELKTSNVTHLNLNENNLETVNVRSLNKWERLQFLDLRKESTTVT